MRLSRGIQVCSNYVAAGIDPERPCDDGAWIIDRSSQEYLADGMTDALITNLAKIRDLRVISRQSVMKYKGTRQTSPEIVRDLKVDAVVEGSVMRSGDRIRITTQLIHPARDRHVWAESYERNCAMCWVGSGRLRGPLPMRSRLSLAHRNRRILPKARHVNPEA